MSMQAAGSGHSGPEEFERELRRSLYRFDCPDAHTLGEYQLDVLDAGQRIQVAAHAAECDDCHGELATLRAFLAEPITVPESLATRARRIVATLFTPGPVLGYAALRGAGDAATRVFEAGDVTVTVGPGQTKGSLFGLVVLSGESSEALEGREVRALPRDGTPTLARLDDLGNFEFSALNDGQYALEIDLPHGVVVIEELQVDFT